MLMQRTEQHRKYVFAQHTTLGTIGAQSPYPMRSVRSDRYKLILNLAPENTYSITGNSRIGVAGILERRRQERFEVSSSHRVALPSPFGGAL